MSPLIQQSIVKQFVHRDVDLIVIRITLTVHKKVSKNRNGTAQICKAFAPLC